jgi:GT2 family glycosyltransferase
VHSKCIEKLLDFVEVNVNTVLVSPEILEYEDINYEKEGFPLSFDIESGLINAYKLEDDYTEVNFVPGTAMLINISKIPKSELHFRDDFFMYHEDIEFSMRMIALGFGEHYFVKGPKVAHASTQSMARLDTCRNALKNCLFCLCYFQNKLAFISRIPKYIFIFLKQYFSYYRTFYPFAYPYYFFLYLGRSIFSKNQSAKGDIIHFQNIHETMNSKMEKLFSFIF